MRSVLMDTDKDHRMKKEQLFSTVKSLVPPDPTHRVDELIQSAIDRLKKRFIRHYTKEEEYCLTHEESERVKGYRGELAVAEAELQIEINHLIQTTLAAQQREADIKALAIRARRILEHVLYSRAEAFACAVLEGSMANFANVTLKDVVLRDISRNPPARGSAEADPELVGMLVREILKSKTEEIQRYLRDLSNAYTLMGFLKATPDVQNAIKKIFSHGEIYLDTTVLLPLLAEELIDPEQREFQRILNIASQAGIEFFVTGGVLEELSSHISRALMYFRKTFSVWEGGIPFIYEAYIRTGANPDEFARWIENFMGEIRPAEDLGTFLRERFGVQGTSLEPEVEKAPEELRHAVDQIWYDIHKDRRERHGRNVDQLTLIRLAKHDTENYVGVLQKRKTETSSPLGYSAWWLTFDRLALSVPGTLKSKYNIPAPPSPVLSIDFLAQCLALGSMRPKVSKQDAQLVPLMIEPRIVQFLTKELLDEAQAIRKQMEGTPERVISRKVRDYLDAARQRMGPIAARGVETFYDALATEI